MSFDDAMKVIGLWTIPIVQLVGPVAIMVWAIYELDWSEVAIRAPFKYQRGSQSHGVSVVFSELLAVLLLFLFCLFSLSSSVGDDENLLKLRLLCTTTKDRAMADSCLLTCVGPFINTWVTVLSCIDMLLVFFLAESPKDVVFDSLGLLFLFNLDDIPGDIDGLLPSWPAQSAGNVYWYKMNAVWAEDGFAFTDPECNTDNGVADPDDAYENVDEISKKYGIGRNCVYAVGRMIMRPMVIALPLFYLLLKESVHAKRGA